MGRPFENARPLAKLNPIRKPVNEPGPMLTAIASILSKTKSVFFED